MEVKCQQVQINTNLKSERESLQNKSLSIITGAVKTTEMQSFRSYILMKTDHKMKIVIFAQKLKSNKDKHNWYHTADESLNKFQNRFTIHSIKT